MNEKAIVIILEILASEYSKKLSIQEKSLKIRTWSMMLEEITDDQGRAGLKKALENPGEFMPPVGKFKQMCLSGSGCESFDDQARVAWSLVIKNLNSWSSPIFKDSSIAETIRNMGGWNRLCSMLTEEEPFRRQDFISLYLVIKRQNKEFPPILKGTCTDDYKFVGYDEGDNIKKVMLQIKQKESSDKKFLGMLRQKMAAK